MEAKSLKILIMRIWEEVSMKKWPISSAVYNDSACESTAYAVVALLRIYYSTRPSKKSMISNRTCAFCATARANSSSGAGSSGVMLVPPVAPPPPTLPLRGLIGPPVEYGQLPTRFPPPLNSRFPEEEKM